MSGKQRIDGQVAYILHSYPYSESSLILDVFSRDHGRLPLLARGARRPRSALRGVLQAFQPLELGWFGGGEVRTLAKAEWLGGIPLLGGTALMLGYYLNELLLKLLVREDAHSVLFESYAATLQALSQGEVGSEPHAASLRQFEKTLLRELGYGLVLERDAVTDEAVLPDMNYHYLIEKGPVKADAFSDGDQSHTMRGKTLLDLARNDYADPRTLAESKMLMRMLINHHLAGQALQSRRVFVELQEL
ncbi:MAG: DNA repair protein RecO [Rhodocyclaceae bacterium]|nr:MAG: DNA repair protein RecO [Rhodocyclaceae bacterium]